LPQFFDYVYTVKDIDYPTYFNYAGLQIDTSTTALPGAWLGVSVRERNDSLIISAVDWMSPAWNAGLRPNDRIIESDGQKTNKKSFDELGTTKKTGDKINVVVLHNNTRNAMDIIFGTKKEKSFAITPVTNPSTLQSAILKDWLRN
jgi:predicted metalloprotease with PDZ domain